MTKTAEHNETMAEKAGSKVAEEAVVPSISGSTMTGVSVPPPNLQINGKTTFMVHSLTTPSLGKLTTSPQTCNEASKIMNQLVLLCINRFKFVVLCTKRCVLYILL